MKRILLAFAFVASVAITGASAQTPAPIHKATVGDVKVSGVVATNTNPGAAPSGVDGVTNVLNKFSDVQPAMPVLTPPANPKQPGASKDCVGSGC